jgi:hypothetical protein
MRGVSLHLPHVECERRDQIPEVGCAHLQHQVGILHRAPELRFHDVGAKLRTQGSERIDHQVVRAHVRGVPILGMRQEHRLGHVLLDDGGDHLDAASPARRVVAAEVDVHLGQSARRGLEQVETDVLAARGELGVSAAVWPSSDELRRGGRCVSRQPSA